VISEFLEFSTASRDSVEEMFLLYLSHLPRFLCLCNYRGAVRFYPRGPTSCGVEVSFT
jgi:hypothetical protein